MSTNNTEGAIPENFKEWVEHEIFESWPYIYDDDAHALQIDSTRNKARQLLLAAYRKLTETKAPVLRWVKAKQIEFAVWFNEKGYYRPNSNPEVLYCNGHRNDWPQMCYTIEELYDLFLEDNPEITAPEADNITKNQSNA